MAPMKFELGTLVATPGAIEAARRAGDDLVVYALMKHAVGDWGVVDDEDKRANDEALMAGSLLLSAYLLEDGTKIWVLTEADRSATTVLLRCRYLTNTNSELGRFGGRSTIDKPTGVPGTVPPPFQPAGFSCAHSAVRRRPDSR